MPGNRRIGSGGDSASRSSWSLQSSGLRTPARGLSHSGSIAMRMPKVSRVHGVIRRRLLVNFRIDPETAQAQLPKPFRPKLHDGYAVGGICLIRLEEIRPRFMPRVL